MAAGYDFSDIRTVVDVGGGRGTLLAAILRGHGHLQGTLFELPAVAAGAEAVLAAAGVMDRCEIVGGDFFHGVPAGADCYVLANVLHDWDDAKAAEILASCRRAVTRHGRVLIVERLIPDDPAEAVPALLSDINMLVLTGGKERTNSEYGELLRAAGLRPGVVRPVTFPYGVIEGLAGLSAWACPSRPSLAGAGLGRAAERFSPRGSTARGGEPSAPVRRGGSHPAR